MATESFTHIYAVTGGMAPNLDIVNLGAIATTADEIDGTVNSSTDISDPIGETTGNLAAQGDGGPFTLVATTNGASVGEPVILDSGGNRFILSNNPMLGTPIIVQNSSPYTFCFAEGTLIATPQGEETVESLSIGSTIVTADGRAVPVKWIGRQTVSKLFAGRRMEPVRIRAGALGGGLPHSDLTVTADHGVVIDGLVINASALINGTTIDWVPMDDLPDRVIYYHVETEDHDVILANGAPAETFIDIPGRQAFDNYQEYLDLYGLEQIVPEMDRPRITSRRLVPEAIKTRLGIEEERVDTGEALRA